MAVVVKDVVSATKNVRIKMLNATDIINQARYSELFTVRARIGNFSLRERAPWNINVANNILTVELPALTQAEAEYKVRQVIETDFWETV
jgi:hypothetical protein